MPRGRRSKEPAALASLAADWQRVTSDVLVELARELLRRAPTADTLELVGAFRTLAEASTAAAALLGAPDHEEPAGPTSGTVTPSAVRPGGQLHPHERDHR